MPTITATLPDVPADLPQGVIVHAADGTVTVQTIKQPLRLADGTIEVTHYDGSVTTHASEDEFRTATGWAGIVFTQENLDFRAEVARTQPARQFVRGQIQSDPHPLLTDYLDAVQRGDFEAAGREAEQFNVRQGYIQYDGEWTTNARGALVIVEMTRDVRTKSGRILLVGDRALGYVVENDPYADFAVFSARSQSAVSCKRGQVRVIATQG